MQMISRKCNLPILPIAALCALSFPAIGEVSIEKAREVAARHAPGQLESGEPTIDEMADTRLLQFDALTPEGQRVGVQVDLSDGFFRGWILRQPKPPGQDTPPVSESEGIRIAKEEARRHLGDSVDDMDWEVVAAPPEELTIRGNPPATGDPPRRGTRPSCRVTIIRRGGQIRSYWQMPGEDPIDASGAVSETEAVSAAEEAVTDHYGGRAPADMGLELEKAYLSQYRGELTWHVKLTGADRAVVVTIDALTGEVTTVAPSDSAAAAPDADEPGPAPPTPGHQPAGMQPLT
ncbi:MAG: hypothetical protein GF320_22050, partial [Armatimonadia bacterium]|nr:hypothetical protein [Armatimonadia bacterium]